MTHMQKCTLIGSHTLTALTCTHRLHMHTMHKYTQAHSHDGPHCTATSLFAQVNTHTLNLIIATHEHMGHLTSQAPYSDRKDETQPEQRLGISYEKNWK